MLTTDTGLYRVDIREKLQGAIDDPDNWDVPGVMQDAIYIINRLEQERDAAQKMVDLADDVIRQLESRARESEREITP